MRLRNRFRVHAIIRRFIGASPQLQWSFNRNFIFTGASSSSQLHLLQVTSFIFSRLEPYVQPTREITKIIKRKFVGCWANYGEIKKKDEVVVELWYKEFQRKYKWLPEMSTTLRRHLIIRLLICTPVQCIGYGRILTQGIGSLLKCVHNWKQHGIKIVGKASHKLIHEIEDPLMVHYTLEGEFQQLSILREWRS
ncbi:hypothetical protein P8452_49309 [Trifolium repens]|nr:hypothetical protein P8452_49309 [Trifolium repens]